jgi:probable rRNA maturation factor
MSSSCIVASTLRTPYPKLPYQQMKDDILGKSYELSLTFVGTVRAQKLNKEYRNKSYIPNVLSFPLDRDTGEIFISPEIARRQAPRYGMSKNGYIGYLFIHGLLHLKGLDHGDTMDKAERKYCTKYDLR